MKDLKISADDCRVRDITQKAMRFCGKKSRHKLLALVNASRPLPGDADDDPAYQKCADLFAMSVDNS